MEWVETTGRSLEEAKDRALDQLGVAADEAEFEILEEPRSGLFGRVRGEARVRARVKPTAVRPKQDRRPRGRERSGRGGKGGRNQGKKQSEPNSSSSGAAEDDAEAGSVATAADDSTSTESESTTDRTTPGGDQQDKQESRNESRNGSSSRRGGRSSKEQKASKAMESNEGQEPDATPDEVGAAAETFMSGLAAAFGAETTTELSVDGTEIDVRVQGAELGLMVGPGGRTLAAVQDLARVAAQRKLGDHDTRLRIDVGGYREKRRDALENFAHAVANQVIESGSAKALEPMSSADRKIVHDALNEIDGVSSRSEGDDPMRRVVISPA